MFIYKLIPILIPTQSSIHLSILAMEVLKLDIVGTYYYRPDIEIVTYGETNNKCESSWAKECVVCKRLLTEPSYDTICDNEHITDDVEIVIGKCGHMFHGDCLGKWLKTCDSCPIDKVKWCLHRIADTTTKLVVYDGIEKKYNDNSKKNKDKGYNNLR